MKRNEIVVSFDAMNNVCLTGQLNRLLALSHLKYLYYK